MDNKKFFTVDRVRSSFYIMLWMMLVTFPLMIMKIDTLNNTMIYRWWNLPAIAVGSFVFSYLWQYFMHRKQMGGDSEGFMARLQQRVTGALANDRIKYPVYAGVAIIVIAYPFIMSLYNTSIMVTALIYVVLGLGLNIIIGWGGLLNLGYAAFFAIGAYTYALLYKYFGIGFWVALPLGGIVSTIFGILLGLPVLRLRGDYLAIVTLAFGEIVRIVLNNGGEWSGGPDGVSLIPRPTLFGVKLKLTPATILTYFIMVGLVIFTVFIMRRLENSRWGRAWEAMKEDEIASESVGVDITQAKLTTFALGSFFAGIAGVVLAAKTTKVTPDSFSLMESVMVLSIVVLGGMGSIPGVIVGAFVLKLLPEYFRAFSSYRILIFAAVLVVMMVFKPEGIIEKIRRRYKFGGEE